MKFVDLKSLRTELLHPKKARKRSGLSRKGPLVSFGQSSVVISVKNKTFLESASFLSVALACTSTECITCSLSLCRFLFFPDLSGPH